MFKRVTYVSPKWFAFAGCCFIKYSTVEEAERAIRALHNHRTLPGVWFLQLSFSLPPLDYQVTATSLGYSAQGKHSYKDAAAEKWTYDKQRLSYLSSSHSYSQHGST